MSGVEWLTPGEVAAIVRRSASTLANWRYRGEGPVYTAAGGRVLYARGDVDAWLEASRVAPGRSA